MDESIFGEKEGITVDSLVSYLRAEYPNRETFLDEREVWSNQAKRDLPWLTDQLRHGGYRTIGELHKALLRVKPAFEAFEKDHPPGGGGCQFPAQGLIRLSMFLLHGESFGAPPVALGCCTTEELQRYRNLISSIPKTV